MTVSKVLILSPVLLLAGCAIRVGPKLIKPDRFDYTAAIASSWKTQMLTNLVKLRYLEPPLFLEISQVVAQYSWDTSAEVHTPDWTSTMIPGASATGRWAESPTFTYAPMTGEKFTKSLLQPVAPASLLELVQAGWPIDFVFAEAVRSINGIHAPSNLQLTKNAGDPRFVRVLSLLRELQLSDTISMRVVKKEDSQDITVEFEPRTTDESLKAKSQEVRKLLGLKAEQKEFKVVFGAVAKDDTELALATRSIFEVLGEGAAGVDVPEAHVKEGRVIDMTSAAAALASAAQVHVRTTPNRPDPDEAYVSMKFKGHWFWVDDKDVRSKRGLGFLMILATLAEAGTSIAPPVLTISKP